MNKLLLLFLAGLILTTAQNNPYCNSSCQCSDNSNVCLKCELDFIGSEIDQYQRSCPCPNGWYKTPYVDCEYIFADASYSPGCSEDCRDYATLEEAKAACNIDPNCQAITWSMASVGGGAATNPIGNGHGYQLRATGSGVFFLPNIENTWLKGNCPNANAIQNPEDSDCGYKLQQGAYLAGCFNDCQDYANLQDAQAACDAQPECGGVTYSRNNIGGANSSGASNGLWGYQLRSGRTFIYSPNGENAWVKQICNNVDYGYANGDFSGGCVQNCLDFANLDEAKIACNADPNCAAITWSFAGVGGSESTNAIGNGRGYQLRASNQGSSFPPNKENSWIKGQDQDSNGPCDFQAYQGSYLGGCAQDCRDFSNLADAEAACRLDPGCGGVTFSRAEVGGPNASNAFDGNWGYQLRAGTNFNQSPNGENSWLKINCPRIFHECAQLIQGQDTETCCQIDIAEGMSSIVVDTTCFFTDENNVSYVNSIVDLDVTQAGLPADCPQTIQTYVQYQDVINSGGAYIDLPPQYVTAGPNGQQIIKIRLIDIQTFAVSTTVGPDQIVQIVNLQIFIGNGQSYLRRHRWTLYVYTDRHEVQAFQIDVDMQQTQDCSGQCIVIADLQVQGVVYTDNHYNVLQAPHHNYIVGDHFYARISFLDATYTKKLDFVALYYKDDQNRIFDYSSITVRSWDGSGLLIDLPLVDPSIAAIIQVNMLIDANRVRFLQGTSSSSSTTSNAVSRQFTVTVMNDPVTATTTPSTTTTTTAPVQQASAAQTSDATATKKSSSSSILFFGLNLLAALLLLL